MKIAISVFKDSVSTVFDAAELLLILEMDEESNLKRSFRKLTTFDPATRIMELKKQDVSVLICGAISRPLQESITAAGIDIHPFIRGTVEEVIAAYLSNQLGQAVFSLPGCGRRKMACSRGQSRGGHCQGRRQFSRPD